MALDSVKDESELTRQNETGKKFTILIVDDTPTNLDVLNNLLGNEHRIKVATNGPKALKIADTMPHPDLILLDIMMPEMDGYEVCKKLKQQASTKDIPIIFLTAKGEVKDEEKGFSLGAVDYITKPAIPPILISRVNTHLQLSDARQTLENQNREIKEASKIREEVERINRHDLKSPLNSVIAMPDFILAGDNLTPDQEESLNAIKDAGYQMLNMINMSLDLFKMEQGTFKLNPVAVDILDLIRKILVEFMKPFRAVGSG